jgi:hypothetical protein
MFQGIWLALLGVLAASNLIIAKRPDAELLIGKVAPYQGWIGALSAAWGVVGLLRCVSHIGLMSVAPVYWLSWLITSVLLGSLGLLLGVGVLKSFITNQKAQANLDRVITKLAPFQGTLGLIAIGLGVWMTIAALMFPLG